MRHPATVNYHIQSAERQCFQFDVDGITGNIIPPELVKTSIQAEDLRDNSSTVNFDVDGITFEKSATKIKDFIHSTDWEDTYNAEIRNLLIDKIGAKDVIVFDHTIRIDDPDSPRTPARNVHNDYSKMGAEERLIDILGKQKASQFSEGHYGFVNVWRPIEDIIRSSPLGFIRPSSIEAEDWMNIDLIYPDEVREILGVAANSNHEWFYQSHMTPEEVAIFNVFDNKGLPYLGHSALDMEIPEKVLSPRKSLESRTIVRY
ncbi:CmcJ/NvfI family oxidoreductase [Cocleimonas flava]|uniref:Methyltransferase n=1 Tax=Cocleimonas flava TaxID=634765 RepID=A0A4R1ETF0_9GAMM|nr:CmcJ/NvfI family oxidoreductase [Cocleimonas flava]TCJ83074.1 hypothetical protein EV695_3812 [Cocleimonas flava]